MLFIAGLYFWLLKEYHAQPTPFPTNSNLIPKINFYQVIVYITVLLKG